MSILTSVQYATRGQTGLVEHVVPIRVGIPASGVRPVQIGRFALHSLESRALTVVRGLSMPDGEDASMLRRRISVCAGLPPALAIAVGLGWILLGCDPSSARQSASRGLVVTGEKMSVDSPAESAVRAAAKSCNGGDAAKCLELADQHSAAVAKDPTQARQVVALLGKACELGLPEGCHRIAAAYQDGTGVARDPGRAADLYEKACAQGFAESCVALGLAFRSGVGRTADATQAARFY
ncbi:MAG: tetratricopeptide repeat protein, partial [Pseudomonadota bacterium]